MEEVACTLCGENRPQFLFHRTDLAIGLPGEFSIVRCQNCQLIYLNPRPTVTSIGYYYPSSYDVYSLPDVDDGRNAWERWFRGYHLNKRCRVVTAHKPSGRILDLGCSNGRFLHQMRHHGTWQRQGVELIPEVAQEGIERYGLDIFQGTLEAAAFADNSFDAITLWDVLEHVYHPVDTLKECRRVLAPDGIIAFSVPVLDSLGGRVFGKYWVGYEVPRHLHVFSRETIHKVLAAAGLTVIDEMVLYGSNYAFADNIRFALRGRGAPQPVYGGIHWLLRHWLWRWPTAPLFKTLDILKQTSIITVVCQPQPH